MAARACAECAHAHARDTRSLRSLVGSPEAPTFPPQDATNTTKTINQHKQAQESLARFARSCAPLRLQHSHHKTRPTPPRQSNNTSRRRNHSLASLARVLPCGSNIPTTRRHSLASLARVLPCGSPFAPVPLRLPPSLRSVGLPASCARGEPPHSVSRAWEGAAQSTIHLLGTHSLRSPSLSLAPLARCRSAPPACCRFGGRFGPGYARLLSTPLRSRHQAALRSDRLGAACRHRPHCLSATALIDALEGCASPSWAFGREARCRAPD